MNVLEPVHVYINMQSEMKNNEKVNIKNMYYMYSYSYFIIHCGYCICENVHMFAVQSDCVWLIREFTPGDRHCSWLGRLLY